MSKAYVTLRHKAGECVGCCLCAEIIPQYFSMNADGLAQLKDSKEAGLFRQAKALNLDRADIEKAVEGCPVDIIHVGKG